MMLPLMLTSHCWWFGKFSPFAGLPAVSALSELFGRTFQHLPNKCRMLLWMFPALIWIGENAVDYWGNSAAQVLLKALHWWKMCCVSYKASPWNCRIATSLTDASRWTHLTMEVLEAMKTTSGKSLAKITSCMFKGITLEASKENINKGQFLQAVIDNLSVSSESGRRTELLAPLEPSCWPKDRNSLVLYGEKEIHDLAKHLGVPTRAAVEEYRFWKLEGDSPGKTIKRLITASKTYLATTAECERGFSAMSDTANKRRSCLRAKSLSSVLFLDINGPPLEQFHPKSFVLSWLKDGHRLSTATKTGRQAQTKPDRPLWTVLGGKVMD